MKYAAALLDERHDGAQDHDPEDDGGVGVERSVAERVVAKRGIRRMGLRNWTMKVENAERRAPFPREYGPARRNRSVASSEQARRRTTELPQHDFRRSSPPGLDLGRNLGTVSPEARASGTAEGHALTFSLLERAAMGARGAFPVRTTRRGSGEARRTFSATLPRTHRETPE